MPGDCFVLTSLCFCPCDIAVQHWWLDNYICHLPTWRSPSIGNPIRTRIPSPVHIFCCSYLTAAAGRNGRVLGSNTLISSSFTESAKTDSFCWHHTQSACLSTAEQAEFHLNSWGILVSVFSKATESPVYEPVKTFILFSDDSHACHIMTITSYISFLDPSLDFHRETLWIRKWWHTFLPFYFTSVCTGCCLPARP